MGRLIAVSSINGDYTGLSNLIDALGFTKEDEIVFLGDYVGQEPQSAEVVDYLVRLRAYRKAWFLMGDKDAQFLDFLMGGECREAIAIADSYGDQPIPWQHIQFFQLLRKEMKVPSVDLGDLPPPIEYVFSHEPTLIFKDNQVNIYDQGTPLQAAILPKTNRGSIEYVQGGTCIQ